MHLDYGAISNFHFMALFWKVRAALYPCKMATTTILLIILCVLFKLMENEIRQVFKEL